LKIKVKIKAIFPLKWLGIVGYISAGKVIRKFMNLLYFILLHCFP
jgi:hypothetical protein